MSNLREWLVKRRGKFYEGAALQQVVADFLGMVDRGAVVHEHPGAIIVLEDFGHTIDAALANTFKVARAWLLFDRFTKATVSAMQKVTREFKGLAIVAQTHDPRMCELLARIGYTLVYHDGQDYYLMHEGAG